ncbi:MAG: hypothetical protein CR991_11535 [Proteobacteria bacterium]|nr:MAG: hypothetical protein CR991_11535 [Pseudomonadota bacterium]
MSSQVSSSPSFPPIGQLEHLFAASQTRLIGDRYAPTGIYKTPIESALINENGIVTDIQADKKVHGGIEKALHQYAQTSYSVLREHFPDLAAQFTVGSMGENISVAAMTEHNVNVGDVWQFGAEVVVQVSQVRSPCWKINDKFGNDNIVKIIDQHSIPGWYYRVLQGGTLKLGDTLSLLERPNPISLRQFLTLYAEHRPDLFQLQALADCVGLTPKWREKIVKRIGYLSALKDI